MGRLQSVKKPAGSSSDPARSAKAAAIKQAQPSKEQRTDDGKPALVSLAQAEALVNRLGKHDLTNVLLEIIESHPETRATVKAFCSRPAGGAERPFDFGSLLKVCYSAIGVVGGAEWEQAGSHRDYYEEKGEVWSEATEPIEEVIRKIRALLEVPTTSTDTKIEAIEALLDIADMVQETGELSGDDWDFPDAQYDLISEAFLAIELAVRSIIPEYRDSTLRPQPVQALMKRFADHDEYFDLVLGDLRLELMGEEEDVQGDAESKQDVAPSDADLGPDLATLSAYE